MKTLKRVSLGTGKGAAKSGAELELKNKVFNEARKCNKTGRFFVICDVDASEIAGSAQLVINDCREITFKAKSGVLLSFIIDKESTTNKAIRGTEKEIRVYFDANSRREI